MIGMAKTMWMHRRIDRLVAGFMMLALESWSEELCLMPQKTRLEQGRCPAGGVQRLWSAELLFTIDRETCDHGRELLEHLRPAGAGTSERLLAPRLGKVKARMLEE